MNPLCGRNLSNEFRRGFHDRAAWIKNSRARGAGGFYSGELGELYGAACCLLVVHKMALAKRLKKSHQSRVGNSDLAFDGGNSKVLADGFADRRLVTYPPHFAAK
jgi:hypothetical protein